MPQTQDGLFWKGDDQNRVDHLAAGTIALGDLVNRGGAAGTVGKIGICTSPQGMVSGQLGSLATKGIFKMKKVVGDAIAFAQGAPVFWDTVNRKCVTGAGANIIRIGLAALAAVAADDHVKTEINEYMLQ